MLEFRVRSTVPPGGLYFYQYKDIKFSNYTLLKLLNDVKVYMNTNKIVIPDNLREIVVDHMCLNLPRGFCRGHTDQPRKKSLTAAMVRDFSKVALGMARYGDDALVTMAEASERAVICANCDENDVSLCMTCKGLRSIARRLVGKRRTSLDRRLGACRVCKCSLGAKVFIRADILAETGPYDYPENCWMNKVSKKKSNKIPF